MKAKKSGLKVNPKLKPTSPNKKAVVGKMPAMKKGGMTKSKNG